VDEEAARKRVLRAVAKLRELLGRKGGVVTSVGLATILATKLVQAAPIGLAERVATTALTHGALAAGAGAAAANAGAPASGSSYSIAQTVERQISLLRIRIFAAYAISTAVFLSACGLAVHKIIFHERQQPSAQVHRD